MPRYISEVIGNKYKQWSRGNAILIKSYTGSGKSQFVKTKLIRWCADNDKSMILLSNRTVLYEQQVNDTNAKIQSRNAKVELKTYQGFNGNLDDYDYVICDECHYFYEDARFNRHTDILYEQIITYDKGVLILLSATPELVEKNLGNRIKEENKFFLKMPVEQYKFYSFKRHDTVIDIIKNVLANSKDDKILFFARSINRALDISKIFKTDSAFICSRNNERYSSHISNEEWNNLTNNQQFSCRVLCATTALDNGINIIDDQVKHIILDVVTPISTLQCLGRKRLNNTEKLNIYIFELSGKTLSGYAQAANNRIKPAIDFQELSGAEFTTKYHKRSTGDILDLVSSQDGEGNTFKINKCIFEATKYDIDFFASCRDKPRGYIAALCEKTDIPFSLIEEMKEYSVDELSVFLFQHEGIPMFRDEQDSFVATFYNIIGIKKDKRLKGYNKLNGFLELFDLPYRIMTNRDTKVGENRFKRYWLLIKK